MLFGGFFSYNRLLHIPALPGVVTKNSPFPLLWYVLHRDMGHHCSGGIVKGVLHWSPRFLGFAGWWARWTQLAEHRIWAGGLLGYGLSSCIVAQHFHFCVWFLCLFSHYFLLIAIYSSGRIYSTLMSYMLELVFCFDFRF